MALDLDRLDREGAALLARPGGAQYCIRQQPKFFASVLAEMLGLPELYPDPMAHALRLTARRIVEKELEEVCDEH